MKVKQQEAESKRHQDFLELMRRQQQKQQMQEKFFLPLWASVWSKNKGGGCFPPVPLPSIHHRVRIIHLKL